ncbi:MAG: chemotaxis protein methyltransferase CheR [Campylobacterota bacterium]|nr:chemotaxis protein methyltransferase CheR [Campylobacterota bacterium]MDQ1267417.1 chemotaxis protein methyltransferase CheR [Campylobacterota bacterium]MDQ1338526.1 chemotaxis protein methyltransferase CheR [Campylobacterota bacterium]
MFDFLKKNTSQNISEKKEAVVEDYNDVLPIAQYFKNETGVTFDKQTTILKSKVTTFCKQMAISSFRELLNAIKDDKKLKQQLVDSLTTNETFFYREFKQIEELVRLVKNEGRRVEILCAPSATGEEPYSIAIALLEAGVMPSNFHVTGIDINSDALNKANRAIYRERNVRNLPPQAIERYFTQESGNYILKDSIKQHVTFILMNLFDPAFKSIGKFDFVFSRNMLIYFDQETKLKAKGILESVRKNSNQEVFFGHADLF